MQATTYNLIQKQTWLLTVGSNNAFARITEDISHLSKNSLAEILDRLCNDYSHDDFLIIDKIELDLGLISLSKLEKDLAGRIQTIFIDQLNKSTQVYRNYAEKRSLTAPPNQTERPDTEAKLEVLTSFITDGILPWWAPGSGLTSPESILEEFTKEKKFAHTEKILSLLRSEIARKRFAFQFSDNIIYSILENLLALNSYEIKYVVEALSGIYSESPFHLKLKLIEILAKPTQAQNEREIEIELLFHICKVKTITTQELLKTIKNYFLNNPDDHFFQLLPIKMIEDEARRRYTFSKSGNTGKANLKKHLIKTNEITLQHEGKIESQIKINIPETPNGVVYWDPAILFESKKVDEDEYYINNSGVVLLAPYLSSFFENLTLIRDGNFIEDTHQFKAVHLLEYLVRKTTESFEYSLQLNKLLTGMDINDTLPRHIRINEEEKEACSELLNAVIRNWPVLKKTSVPTFRESFLIRNGKLMKVNSSWKLIVETRPFDLLLEKLPWSISIVKLPWMYKPLLVEWI